MTTPFSWNNPSAWPRKPLLAANVVSTSQPLAAQAGLQMLAAGGSAGDAILAPAIPLTLVGPVFHGIGPAGGSAVDASLATAITLTRVEPVSNGIGSDAYAIVWDGKKLHGLNASGR